MKTIEVIIEHAGTNLSAYINELPIITVGDTIAEIEANIKDAIALYLEDNDNPSELLKGEYEIRYRLDAATFINYYSGVFTKSALSRITGINERQLWHYAAGVHKPRKNQIDKMERGLRTLTNELSAISVGV